MKKKFLALALAAVCALSTACGAAPAADQSAAAGSESNEGSEASQEATDDKTYLVGICQLVQHPALDAATQGFKDALTDEFG
ncbi:MAG: ABC transporter substrate-binding protein, partial [Lachnospiraceae bacterium]|nr:ABC transporter substrate-binding protein [Lachnospiraceae bacterium]